jgi:hypothetical protein
LDLDAGGELLDLTAFQMRSRSTAQQGTHKQQQTGSRAAQQQGCVTGPELCAIQGRLGDLAVGGGLWQWPHCVVQASCAPAVSSGSSFGIMSARDTKGKPLTGTTEVPCGRVGAGRSGGRSAAAATGTHGSHVVVCGSITEVSDAVAQMWLCCAVASLCHNG